MTLLHTNGRRGCVSQGPYVLNVQCKKHWLTLNNYTFSTQIVVNWILRTSTTLMEVREVNYKSIREETD